jgi:hypothetical protein
MILAFLSKVFDFFLRLLFGFLILFGVVLFFSGLARLAS